MVDQLSAFAAEVTRVSREVGTEGVLGGRAMLSCFVSAYCSIGEPGLVETVDPRTGKSGQTVTGTGAHTTVLVPPDQLYVISPAHGVVLVLADG